MTSENDSNLQHKAKKLCTTLAVIQDDHDFHEKNSLLDFSNFEDFELEKILNNSDNCLLAVEGKFKGKDGKAVVVLQKVPFCSEKVPEILSKNTSLRTLFKNDVYFNLIALLPPDLNDVKATIIYPAEEKHVKRYEKTPSSFICETPELYKKITTKFINSSSFSKQWIYNILEHKKEVDRIIFEDLDPEIGFILVPDLKWSGEQMEDLYLQALVLRRDINCIRDLRKEHIPLLENVYNNGIEAIKKKYGVSACKLRVYFHYQPSFYHLHVHFSALSFDAPGTWTGKAHLLQDVISNLQIDSEYYKKAWLSFTIKDTHPLKKMFEEEGYFNEK